MKRVSTRIAWFLLISILLVYVPGCGQHKRPRSLRQEKSQIVKVEICSYDGHEKSTLLVLSDFETEKLLLYLSIIESFEYFPGDHPREYGEKIICIHYANNEIEVIGETNIGWISQSGQWHLTRYSYEWGAISTLIAQYMGV